MTARSVVRSLDRSRRAAMTSTAGQEAPSGAQCHRNMTADGGGGHA